MKTPAHQSNGRRLDQETIHVHGEYFPWATRPNYRPSVRWFHKACPVQEANKAWRVVVCASRCKRRPAIRSTAYRLLLHVLLKWNKVLDWLARATGWFDIDVTWSLNIESRQGANIRLSLWQPPVLSPLTTKLTSWRLSVFSVETTHTPAIITGINPEAI